ncbi:MAG: helix-turn-helix transcriptional regulator [Acidimicrobiia bacterium]
MRADRLMAVLFLLQARGHVTASEVAAELEVSERTARRDLEALGMAGVPVYPRQGRNGGWQLIGGARTDLSGLTVAEVRALFLVAGPASTATPQVKAALRKLVSALPEPFRESAELATTAIVIDPSGWGRAPSERPPPQHLEAVQQAIVQGEQVTLGYVARNGDTTSRVIHPLGLASKGPVWYLVAGTEKGQRTFRVDRMVSVEPTGDRVVRPEGFDLAEAWRLITDELDELRLPVRARGTASPDVARWLRVALGTHVRIGPADEGGRVAVEIRGHDPGSVAREIAGFGGGIDLSEPPEVREELARLGAELARTYGPPTEASTP